MIAVLFRPMIVRYVEIRAKRPNPKSVDFNSYNMMCCCPQIAVDRIQNNQRFPIKGNAMIANQRFPFKGDAMLAVLFRPMIVCRKTRKAS